MTDTLAAEDEPLTGIELALYEHFRHLDCPSVVDPVDVEDCANMAVEVVRFMRAAGWDDLAAVLPAHRRQVLEEAAGEQRKAAELTGWFLTNDDLRKREHAAHARGRATALTEAATAIEHQPFDHKINDGTRATGGYFRPQTVLDILRRLASAAPETAPTPRQDDETAPAVPDTKENP